MRVNLLKDEVRAFSIQWREVIDVLLLIIFIVGLASHYYLLYSDRALLENNLQSLNNQISNYKVKVAEYNRLKDDVAELESIKQKINQLKYNWNLAVEEQGYVVPDKLMFKNVEIVAKKLSINGRAINNEKVLKLINNMKLSPIYQEVTLINVAQNYDVEFKVEAVISGEDDL